MSFFATSFEESVPNHWGCFASAHVQPVNFAQSEGAVYFC